MSLKIDIQIFYGRFLLKKAVYILADYGFLFNAQLLDPVSQFCYNPYNFRDNNLKV